MWLRCWRRALALLAHFAFLGTLLSPLMLAPEAFYGVQLWFRTPASDSSELGQVARDRAAFRYESLFALFEDPASLQFPPLPLLYN